jgi:hypothetical protein
MRFRDFLKSFMAQIIPIEGAVERMKASSDGAWKTTFRSLRTIRIQLSRSCLRCWSIDRKFFLFDDFSMGCEFCPRGWILGGMRILSACVASLNAPYVGCYFCLVWELR